MIPAPKEVGAGTGRWPRGCAGEASGRLGLSTIWATSGTLNAAMRDRDIDAASLDGFGAFSLAAATRAVRRARFALFGGAVGKDPRGWASRE
jgi:hypothetical protein